MTPEVQRPAPLSTSVTHACFPARLPGTIIQVRGRVTACDGEVVGEGTSPPSGTVVDRPRPEGSDPCGSRRRAGFRSGGGTGSRSTTLRTGALPNGGIGARLPGVAFYPLRCLPKPGGVTSCRPVAAPRRSGRARPRRRHPIGRPSLRARQVSSTGGGRDAWGSPIVRTMVHESRIGGTARSRGGLA